MWVALTVLKECCKDWHRLPVLFLSSLEENENDGEIDDLLAYLQHQLTVEHSSQKICQPEVETSQVHISGKIKKFHSDIWRPSCLNIMIFLLKIDEIFFLFLLVCVPVALPLEVLMYIFRWVVSSDLDMRALEQLSLVCRGFYILARWRPCYLRCANVDQCCRALTCLTQPLGSLSIICGRPLKLNWTALASKGCRPFLKKNQTVKAFQY